MYMSWSTQMVNAHKNARKFFFGLSWNINGKQKCILFDQMYYHKSVKHFRKETSLLVSKCILEFNRDHTFQFLLALMKAKFLVKFD